jgi:branched-chain amino acid aminotransferase
MSGIYCGKVAVPILERFKTMTDSLNGTDWSKGAGYVDGRFCPIAEAKIPITDWGYPRSDVTYGVVGV